MTERAIFEAAIEITNLIKREAFLNEACAGDAALRERLEVLLASHGKASQFLNVPVVEQIQQSGDDASSQTTMMPKSDTPQAREEDDGDSERNAGPDISFLQPSSKPGSIGLLGHYEILQILGQGAFGVVFKAFDEKLHRMVAIKVMNPALAATSPPRKRFLREARSSAAVRHENIVAIHAVEEQPVPYLVMEYIPGKTLQQWQDEHGPFDPGDILKFGQQIAAGLAAAHAQGLIHRDIKPANILLDTSIEARIKITDFGLARAVDDASMTQSGLIAGTPMYMAPEQARGQTLDHRADLFSLGTVLYTMASGRPPFRASNTIAVLKRVCEDTPRPVSEVIPGSPRWLDEIIAKLHAKEPDDRFQTAKEVSDLLARCQSELQLNGQVTCVAVPPQHDASASGRDESRPPKSSPHVPREESRTSTDANRATDNALPTMSTPRSAYFTRSVKATFGSLIAITVIAGIFIKLRPNDRTENSASRAASAPGQSESDKVRGLTPPGSPKQDVGWQGWPSNAPPPAIAPFNAEQAKKHQEAWAKYLDVPVEYTNSIGMKFRLIPPGEFTMGSTKEEIEEALKITGKDTHWQECMKSEAPQHKVILTQPIYLGVNEVTQAEYEKVMGINPSGFASMGTKKEAVTGMETTSHPVETVSWNDAAEFCAKLSKQEELKLFYSRAGETITPLDGTGYRLPTEAEWEYACRAGTTTKYWIGDKDEDLVRADWFGTKSGGRTHAAGELKANPYGLCDIHGNVWEWVEDWWGPTYYGESQEKPAINPNAPSSAGSLRVLRGGHWFDHAFGCRAADRYAQPPTSRHGAQGFRVSLGVAAVRRALKMAGPAMPQSAATAPSVLVGWHGWPAEAPPPAIAPFDAEQAKKHQEAWAKYLDVPVEYTNSIGMKFRLIPPGEFTMGSTAFEIEAVLIEAAFKDVVPDDKHMQECIKSEAPRHKVILTQPVYLGVNEVTQAEYEKVMGVNPSHFAPLGAGKEAVAGLETIDHPVEWLSWNDAAEFCVKLSKQEKLKPFYFREGETITPLDGTGYRLPSEAEWEFACRAGTATKYWIGDRDEDLVRAGWFRGNAGDRTHAAGELKANPFGLHDIHGNVWEWVQDGWDASWYRQFQEKPAINPNSPFSAGSQRVFRGGGWYDTAYGCRSPNRLAVVPSSRRSVSSMSVFVCRWSSPPTPTACAAEWVLSIGGKIQVNDQERDIPAAELPKQPFRLTGVNLQGNQKVTDAGLAHFKDCKNLMVLYLDRTAVTDAGLAHFMDCKNLTRLYLSGTAVTDAGLGHFQDCKNLTELSLDHMAVTDAGLAHFKDCKNLTQLNLGQTAVTDAGLAHFKDCKNLAWLNLDRTAVTDAGLAHFQDCKNLMVLYLDRTAVTDAGLAHFKDCKNLTRLKLYGTRVTDAGLGHFQDCKNLTELSLDHMAVTDAGLAHFKDCKNLRQLNLGQTAVTDAGLAHLKDCKNLTELNMADTNVSDSGLEQLARYSKLTFLNVTNTKVTEAGVKKLSAALPGCKIAWDGGVIEPMVVSADPDRRAAEWVLSIGGVVRVNDQERDITAAELPKEPFRLMGVNLQDNKKVTDAGLAHFKDCKNLTVLDLAHTAVTDAGLVR